MPIHPVERKLAAILAADVAGYSRLMGHDEAGTLARLKEHRRELIDPKIAEHKGRIVKTTGDGILIEFPSVVEAVACAVAVQLGMAERNVSIREDQRIVFRVGINLGDIIVEDADIHGDGVNVAARLEAISEPGGICISATVRDHIGDRLDLAFDDLGEQALKNIARPVRAYRVLLATAERAPTISSVETTPTLALPDKPSIAVLPFANMSGDPEQEYFADGISEDIITALSKLSQLFVIARNSSFTFFAHGYNSLGVILHYVGRSEEALPCFERAMALDPFCPGMVLHFHGQAYFQLRRYEEAAAVLKRRILRFPETDASRVLLAACYGEMGRLDEAREQWREALRVNPDFSLDYRRKVLPYKNPADFEAVVDGLRKAGVVK